MTQQTIPPAADRAELPGAPRLGGLFRSEVRRARSRRSLVWMSALTLLGVVLVSAIMFLTTGAVDQADLDAGAERAYAEQMGWYQECLQDPTIPAAEREDNCYRPSQQDIERDAVYYVSPSPFSNDSMTGLIIFAGAIAAVVAMLMGASAGGADWGARTMSLVFSWEPRRLRVFFTRLLVVLILGLVITAVSVALAWGLGALIAGAHGLDPSVRLPADQTSMRAVDLDAAREVGLRWLPLGVLAAAGGYAVAMATRSTGWAIGATVALIMIAEPLVQVLWPWGSQWLVQTNVAAWMSGGMEWLVNPSARSGSGSSGMEIDGQAGTIFLSQSRAMVVMVLMVLIVLGVAATLLRRRDVD